MLTEGRFPTPHWASPFSRDDEAASKGDGPRIPFRDHPLMLERYGEDQCGPPHKDDVARIERRKTKAMVPTYGPDNSVAKVSDVRCGGLRFTTEWVAYVKIIPCLWRDRHPAIKCLRPPGRHARHSIRTKKTPPSKTKNGPNPARLSLLLLLLLLLLTLNVLYILFIICIYYIMYVLCIISILIIIYRYLIYYYYDY